MRAFRKLPSQTYAAGPHGIPLARLPWACLHPLAIIL